MRTPISLVRRATRYDITPYKPTAEISAAKAPKKPDNVAMRRSRNRPSLTSASNDWKSVLICGLTRLRTCLTAEVVAEDDVLTIRSGWFLRFLAAWCAECCRQMMPDGIGYSSV